MTAADFSDSHVYFDCNLDVPEARPLAFGQVAVWTHRAPGKQSPNEDAAAVIPCSRRAGVLLIADGLGGNLSGERAARLTIEAIRESLSSGHASDALLRSGILNGVERANEQVRQLGLGAATTLAAVEIDGSLVRPYHVGDSMILLTSNRGNVKFQTVSHSPMGYAVESGLLDAQEAIFHEHRHVVSNVIGCSNMRIEIGPGLQMAPRDTLLLASDGLFDNLHLDEIVAVIRKGNLSVAAKKLVDDAQQRMAHPANGHPSKPDDLTFILFRLPPAPRKRNRSAADAKPAKLSAESSPKT